MVDHTLQRLHWQQRRSKINIINNKAQETEAEVQVILSTLEDQGAHKDSHISHNIKTNYTTSNNKVIHHTMWATLRIWTTTVPLNCNINSSLTITSQWCNRRGSFHKIRIIKTRRTSFNTGQSRRIAIKSRIWLQKTIFKRGKSTTTGWINSKWIRDHINLEAQGRIQNMF